MCQYEIVFMENAEGENADIVDVEALRVAWCFSGEQIDHQED